jgi:hypothetical protein
MENNNFGLEEVVTNGVTAVSDVILDSKNGKNTTVILLVGAAGLTLGWLAKAGWNKFKKRKEVITVEAEVVDNGDRIVN